MPPKKPEKKDDNKASPKVPFRMNTRRTARGQETEESRRAMEEVHTRSQATRRVQVHETPSPPNQARRGSRQPSAPPAPPAPTRVRRGTHQPSNTAGPSNTAQQTSNPAPTSTTQQARPKRRKKAVSEDNLYDVTSSDSEDDDQPPKKATRTTNKPSPAKSKGDEKKDKTPPPAQDEANAPIQGEVDVYDTQAGPKTAQQKGKTPVVGRQVLDLIQNAKNKEKGKGKEPALVAGPSTAGGQPPPNPLRRSPRSQEPSLPTTRKSSESKTKAASAKEVKPIPNLPPLRAPRPPPRPIAPMPPPPQQIPQSQYQSGPQNPFVGPPQSNPLQFQQVPGPNYTHTPYQRQVEAGLSEPALYQSYQSQGPTQFGQSFGTSQVIEQQRRGLAPAPADTGMGPEVARLPQSQGHQQYIQPQPQYAQPQQHQNTHPQQQQHAQAQQAQPLRFEHCQPAHPQQHQRAQPQQSQAGLDSRQGQQPPSQPRQLRPPPEYMQYRRTPQSERLLGAVRLDEDSDSDEEMRDQPNRDANNGAAASGNENRDVAREGMFQALASGDPAQVENVRKRRSQQRADDGTPAPRAPAPVGPPTLVADPSGTANLRGLPTLDLTGPTARVMLGPIMGPAAPSYPQAQTVPSAPVASVPNAQVAPANNAMDVDDREEEAQDDEEQDVDMEAEGEAQDDMQANQEVAAQEDEEEEDDEEEEEEDDDDMTMDPRHLHRRPQRRGVFGADPAGLEASHRDRAAPGWTRRVQQAQQDIQTAAAEEHRQDLLIRQQRQAPDNQDDGQHYVFDSVRGDWLPSGTAPNNQAIQQPGHQTFDLSVVANPEPTGDVDDPMVLDD